MFTNITLTSLESRDGRESNLYASHRIQMENIGDQDGDRGMITEWRLGTVFVRVLQRESAVCVSVCVSVCA